jgi:DNA-directed RNA polymerase specialized sigma24 family protein
VTLNIVLMHLRRNRTAVALGDSFDDNTTDGNYVGEFAPPDTSAAGVIDRLNLARAIQELSAAYKRFFYLHDVIGYEQAEIARLLGCSTGSSKSHLRRAHKCLHRLLQGERSSPHRHLAFRHVSFNGAVRPRRVTTGSRSVDTCARNGEAKSLGRVLN